MPMSRYRFLQVENAFRRSQSDYKGMAIELIDEIRRCQNIIESQQSRLNIYKACTALKFQGKKSPVTFKVACR